MAPNRIVHGKIEGLVIALNYPLRSEKQPSQQLILDIANALEPSIQAAGEAIVQLYHQPEHRVQTKQDQTPVTEADLASHDLLVDALQRLTPAWPVVSEEDSAQHQASRPVQSIRESVTPYWLIDPLDGTREFIARTGEFSINIGLVVGQEAYFGILYGPIQGILYRGGIGLAAERKTRDEPVWHPIHCRSRPQRGGIQISSRRSSPPPPSEHPMQQTHLGSALKFGRIAEGNADLYVRRGPTMEWDTCAGHAIVEAAGGEVQCLDGGPLRYGKAEWRNKGFVVRGRA